MKIQKTVGHFEPSNPIMISRDFTKELIKYCDNNKELTIIHEGMEPVVK